MRLIRHLLTLAVVTALIVAAVAHPVSAAERQVTLTIRTVVDNPSSTPATVTLNIPLISDTPSPYQTLVAESFSPRPVDIRETAAGRTGTFEVRVPAGQSVTIEERYVLALRPYERPEPGDHQLAADQRALYLRGEDHIEADHNTLRQAAARLTEGVEGAGAKAERVFSFVRRHLRYDSNSKAKNQGALAAFEAGSGVCEEFASLFVALMRAAGVPARVVNGYVLLDAQRHLTTEGFAQRVRHQWAEYFDPEYGWVPVDPTFESSLDKSLTRPAYVRQNFGDRPVTGKAQGGQVKVSRGVTVTEAPVQTAKQD